MAAPLVLAATVANGADFSPEYTDSAGEGFFSNDTPDTASAEGGNPGDTLGAQRRWAFEKALEFWGLRLDSPVTIRVGANMDSLDCSGSTAVLGQAGPFSFTAFSSSTSPHPIPNTWYPYALVDRFQGTDFDSSNPDVTSTFNSEIDNGCFNGGTWYYALGDPPGNRPSFYENVLHELAHGLGFLTIVDLDTGERAIGSDDVRRDDVYMVFLEDHSLSQTTWPDLTDMERENSVTDTNDLHWVGTDVLGSIGELDNGTSGGHVEMYAPSSLKPGSSVSHWDSDVVDTGSLQDIMTPVASDNQKLLVTEDLLHDIGWNDAPANNCVFADDRLTENATFNGSNSHEACISITYDGAVIGSGNTDALAGQQIVLQNGFTVMSGATFGASTDPGIGL